MTTGIETSDNNQIIPNISASLVILFLDVDGVLNTNWYGATHKIREPEEDLEPGRLQCLAELCLRLEASGYSPYIVFSTTWRYQSADLDRLLTALANTQVDNEQQKTLREYVFGKEDPSKEASTPSLGRKGTEPEDRAMQINAWLKQNTPLSGFNDERPLYLALDDLNLCFGTDGKVNSSFHAVHLLHTINEETPDNEHDIGLTMDRVEEALDKIKKQQSHAMGGFDAKDWELLQTSGLPMDILAKPTCPPFINDQARQWLLQEKKKNSPQTRGCACTVS